MSESAAAIPSLRSLHVAVSDLEQSIAFYRDALALAAERDEGGAVACVLLGCGTRLILDAELGRKLEVGPRYGGGAPHMHLHLEADDLDALRARLEQPGHAVHDEAGVPVGVRILVTSDPDGHNLEIIQHAPAS